MILPPWFPRSGSKAMNVERKKEERKSVLIIVSITPEPKTFRSSKLLPRILGSANKKYEMPPIRKEPAVEKNDKEEDTEDIISEILKETKGEHK